MEPVKYELTREDCHDFVTYQITIPRIKKYVLKTLRIFHIVMGAVILLFILLPIFVFCLDVMQASTTTGLPLKDLFVHPDFLPFVWFSLKQFMITSFPIIAMFLFAAFAPILSLRYDWFKATSKRVYTMQKGNDLEVEISLNDEGVFCKGENTIAEYKWAKVIDIYNTGKSLLLFVADYMAIIIPHRAFRDEAHIQEFLDIVNSKISGKDV